MKLLRRLTRWPWRHDASLSEEMEYHRAQVQAELERQGTTRADAFAESRRRMGNVTLAREDSRDVWIFSWADRLWRDAKHGLRGLRREKTFTLTTVLTLALGVTATTSVFSVVDAQLWRPLPFPRPDQLIALYSKAEGSGSFTDPFKQADLDDWRASAPAFSGIAATADTSRVVLQRDTAQSLLMTTVTRNYFTVLGRPPLLGRTFDATSGGPREAVITDRAWRRYFDSDASVVGRSFTIDGEPTAIAGVVVADGVLGQDPDLYVAAEDRAAADSPSAMMYFGAVGRLQPGAGSDAAQSQIQAIVTRRGLAASDPRTHTVVVEDLREYYTGSSWRPLVFFLGASIVVLLLSAVNAATLLLARASRRTREFALRGALGGGRGALARQLIVEGALVALPAGAFGLLLASWAVRAITTTLPESLLQHGTSIPVDMRAAAFAFAVTVVTTVIFALAPMAFTQRINLSSALGQGERAGQSGAEGRARQALVTVQIALTMMLLFGAGIFLKSFAALTHMPLGFNPTNAIALRVSLNGSRYSTGPAVRDYADRLLEQARSVPGVQQAAIGSGSPLGSGPLMRLVARDLPHPPAGSEPRAIARAVTPDYFRTLGIQIVRGREFTSDDADTAPRVAIVNESFARQVFGNDSPLGRTLDPAARSGQWAAPSQPIVIVGVAHNIKEVGMNEVDFGDIYLPFAQLPSPAVELVARGSVPAAGLADTLRQRAARIDPAMPVTSVTTFDARVSHALQGDRFNLMLIGSFAGLALALAGIGIYGAIAYSVQARTRELGVRLALGAQPGRLVGAVLWQAGRLGLIGAAIGLAGTLALAVPLGNALYLVPGDHEGLLYGVTTTDPAVLAAAGLGIVLMALVAGALPARRVASVDPVLALRHQ
jgi:putative ABC transport system permease protein